nr:NADH dehydrogenase subunit 6 [Monopterus albus]
MSYLVCVLLFGLMVGSVGVASNPSPYFAAMGLVMVSGVGCGVLICFGGSFLPLVFFLIYLGGMMVVFAFSAALSAEPYPYGWGNRSVKMYVAAYVLGIGCAWKVLLGEWSGFWGGILDESGELLVLRGDMMGVAAMHDVGGWMLVLGGLGLLLTLFVVLELVRGVSRGGLRAV